jgi:hypothetical protein
MGSSRACTVTRRAVLINICVWVEWEVVPFRPGTLGDGSGGNLVVCCGSDTGDEEEWKSDVLLSSYVAYFGVTAGKDMTLKDMSYGL